MTFMHKSQILKILLLSAIVALFGIYLLTKLLFSEKPIIVNDLYSLLPTSDRQELIDSINSSVYKSQASNFILLVSSDDITKRTEAVRSMAKQLDDIEHIKLVDLNRDLHNNMSETLSEYRRTLISSIDRNKIAEGDIDDILFRSYTAHLGLSPSISSLSINDDPLLLFDSYLQQYVTHTSEVAYVENNIVIQHKKNNITKEYVLLVYSLHQDSSLNEIEQTSNQITRAIDNTKSSYDAIEIIASGSIFHIAQSSKSTKKEIVIISLASLILISLLFLYTFKNIIPLLLMMGSLVFATLGSMAVSIFFFSQIHLIILVFGVSLFGVAVDYIIHYSAGLYYSTGENSEYTHSSITRASALAMITTLLGYTCLSIGAYSIMQQMALFCCCGVLLVWLFIATITSFLTPSHQLQAINHVIADKYQVISFKPLHLASISVVSMLIIVFLWNDDVNISAYYDPPKKLTEQDVLANTILKQYENNKFIVVKGSSPQLVLERLEKIQPTMQSLKLNAHIEDYAILTTFVPSEKKQKDNFALIKSVAVGTSSPAVEVMEKFSFDKKDILNYQNDYHDDRPLTYLHPDTWKNVAPSYLGMLWLGKINQEYASLILLKGIQSEKELSQLRNEYEKIDYINFITDLKKTMIEQKQHAVYSLLIAYLLVAMLCIAYYQSKKSLIIVLLPLLSTLITLSIVAIVSTGTLNLFHILGLFLLMGLGLDYGIFLYNIKNAKNADRITCILAIKMSILTTAVSFGLLVFVSIPMISSFGQIILVGTIISALLLPTMQAIIYKNNQFNNV